MGVPKRRTSKSRIRTRKHAHNHPKVTSQDCPHCGKPRQPHRVCPSCGKYGTRQVVSVSIDE